MSQVSNEKIEQFLNGSNNQKYIVAIEAAYHEPIAHLVIHEPNKPKRIEESVFKPFLWFKSEVFNYLYEGKVYNRIKAENYYGVKIEKLRTHDDNGFSPERMQNGFVNLATCTKSLNNLIQFFKDGGVDVFDRKEETNFSKYFIMFSPVEQYMIQTGKRLFKGMEDYDDLHRFQFDLETEGLLPSKNAISQIGVRDNRGVEYILETEGDGVERRQSEVINIGKFFKIIEHINPDIIAGYNSENFDWPFLFDRAVRLGVSVPELAITLNRAHTIKRKKATIKFGGETENYEQTYMWGLTIIDISHAVRRAMAINSEIKAWGLKYITQYSDIAKPNRVYVPGDKINSTWADTDNKYAFNDTNGDWYMITEDKPLKEGYVIQTGKYIVRRYLCDDLWETEQIDKIFNQASFLIGKMLPTNFQRSSTMGTAGQWKLLMAAWSYESKLAIPDTQKKKDFTGGLSRLLEVGYARNVAKLDFADLYPKTQLTHDIFPDLDISGVMKGMLTYVVDTRDHYKFLTGKEKETYKALEKKLKANKENMSADEIKKITSEIHDHKALANLYDKKQLPLKILANSWFGSYGAPYIFNWGDINSAEETTCRGRQYLRLMVKHFTEKHKMKALVLDTDGVNFSIPDTIDDFKYTPYGNHWKTNDSAGIELSGIEAALAEFNETKMKGRMGLDIDDICNSTINFSRKNYANDISGKIKFVGNSIKSKKMSVYIEDFLSVAIKLLLNGDGHSFINLYYEYVDKIYNYQIPLVKIASKAKVKQSIPDYKKKSSGKNKRGNPMPKQAHMELAISQNIDVTLGDTLYYINTGNSKSQGDLKTINRSKMSKKELERYVEANGHEPKFEVSIQLNCKMIEPSVVEKDFEMLKEVEILKKALLKLDENDQSRKKIEERIEEINTELYTEEYNVPRYLDAFNKKVKPLLVCFHPDIRNKILLDIDKIKDKKTKKVTEKLRERNFFTKEECTLVSGMPNKESDQDSYEDLMIMEDKEIRFWDRVDKVPNGMTNHEWSIIRKDYLERMEILKEEGVESEKYLIEQISKKLELEDLKKAIHVVPKVIADICYLDDIDENKLTLISKKWNVELCDYRDIFKYKHEAIERDEFYKMKGCETQENRYEQYQDYIQNQRIFTGETPSISVEVRENIDKEDLIENTKKTYKIDIRQEEKKKTKLSEDVEEDGEVEEEDENGDVVRVDDKLILDDEIDDTIVEIPEDYQPQIIEVKKEEPEDEWGF